MWSFRVSYTFVASMKMIAAVTHKVEELFMKYGIKSVSMDDICKELSMSKKTLYQCFSSKENLVSEVVQRFMQGEITWSEQALRDASDPVHHLILIAKHVSQLLLRLSSTATYDLQKYYRKYWSLIEQQRRSLVLRQISENLTLGIEQGIYRKDIDIDLVSNLYLRLATFIMDENSIDTPQEKNSQLYIEFVKYHIRGIATEKGVKLLNKYEYLLNK